MGCLGGSPKLAIGQVVHYAIVKRSDIYTETAKKHATNSYRLISSFHCFMLALQTVLHLWYLKSLSPVGSMEVI